MNLAQWTDDSQTVSDEELCERLVQVIPTLDPEIRREYDEAMAAVPWLVVTETKPLDFLRTENRDYFRGAMRLMLYWKYRKVLFGERWLLPMTQTGTGALSPEDVDILRQGNTLFVLRPNQGPILYNDPSRVDRKILFGGPRCVYYLVTVLTNEYFQTDGATIVKVVHGQYVKRPEMGLDRDSMIYLLQALPWRIKKVVVAQSHEEGREILIDTFAYNEARQWEFQTGAVVARLASNSVKGVLTSMAKNLGINVHHTPQSLGGKFDYTQYLADWIRMRLSHEELFGGATMIANQRLVRGTAVNLNTSNDKNGTMAVLGHNHYHSQGNSSKNPVLTCGNATAWNMESPIRIPTATTDSTATTLTSAAQHIADQDNNGTPPVIQRKPGESEQDFRRRRNSYYANRKNQKFMRTRDHLEKQVRLLETKNKMLTAENRKLENFLAKARYLAACAANEESVE